MNGYQRVMSAMKLKEPDRVPISEFIIDKKVYNHFFPEAKNQTELEVGWDLDTVSCGVEFFPVEILNPKEFIDEWGVRYHKNDEQVAHPAKGCIYNMADINNYCPPDPYHLDRLGRLPELVAKYKGEKAIIFHQRAAFMWSCYLMEMDKLLLNLIIEPDLCSRVLDMVLDVNIKIAKRAIRAGADIIVLGDDYAHNKGPLMSPDTFDEFILPRLKKMVDVIHEQGALVIKHSDGNLMKIIDSIVDTGIDGLNPIEPVADMDLAYMKEKYGDRICLWGNVDCGSLLSFGSKDEVEQTVKKCIQDAAKGGGYVLTSSNSIHSSVNPDNYKAMVDAGKKYGKSFN